MAHLVHVQYNIYFVYKFQYEQLKNKPQNNTTLTTDNVDRESEKKARKFSNKNSISYQQFTVHLRLLQIVMHLPLYTNAWKPFNTDIFMAYIQI